jgi:AsmA protein
MKRTILVIGILLAVVVLAAISLPFLINANQFRPRVEASLGAALGRKVSLGDLSLSLFRGKVNADNLSIADDPRFHTGPFVHARSLALGVEVWPLITKHQLNVTELKIIEPDVTLIQNPAGEWNFSTAGSPPRASAASVADSGGTPLSLSARQISIERGRLSVSRLGTGQMPAVLENAALVITNFAPGVPFPFSLTGKLAPAGDIRLEGTAGPINQANPSLTPVQLKLKTSGVDLAGLGILAGSGLAGVLNMDGAGSIQGTSLDSKGTVHIDQARFARNGTPAKQPVAFDFAVVHNLQSHTGTLRQGDLHLGDARLSLTGTYGETAGGTVLNLRLNGPAMPIGALQAMLPALDIQLPAGSSLQGGTASVNATMTGPAANAVIAGTAALSNTKLRGFDLGSKIGAVERIVGIQPTPDTVIQTLSATLRSDAAGTAIQNLHFIAPAIGELDGAGTIDPRHNLDFKMRAVIHTSGAILAAVGQRHDTTVPFFVQGSAANPQFKPDVAGIAASEIQRFSGKKIGGVDTGQAINALQGLFGGKKKQ